MFETSRHEWEQGVSAAPFLRLSRALSFFLVPSLFPCHGDGFVEVNLMFTIVCLSPQLDYKLHEDEDQAWLHLFMTGAPRILSMADKRVWEWLVDEWGKGRYRLSLLFLLSELCLFSSAHSSSPLQSSCLSEHATYLRAEEMSALGPTVTAYPWRDRTAIRRRSPGKVPGAGEWLPAHPLPLTLCQSPVGAGEAWGMGRTRHLPGLPPWSLSASVLFTHHNVCPLAPPVFLFFP